MLQEMIRERKIPALMDRQAMLALLQREEYGMFPPQPDTLVWEEAPGEEICGGAAVLTKVMLRGTLGGRAFAFPVYRAMPKAGEKLPFFVFLNFGDEITHKYYPVDLIMQRGFAVISICYTDVTSDDGDFTNGLAGAIYPDGRRGMHDAGKIALWAWAAQRAMDYAQHVERLDLNIATVCGHSRLGKTALLAGALDERFRCVYSNDSGCSGAAITREKQGERIADICRNFPYWFCPRYAEYAGREQDTPFEQHMLLASIAPRPLLIGSASEDLWADPASEFLACYAAGAAWTTGLITPDALPDTGDCLFDGDIGYHLREGEHFFSREDWLRLMRFVTLKRA